MFDRRIASDFVQMFPETQEGLRTVGREAEYAVVDSRGFAADIEPLLQKMFNQYDDYSIVRKDGVNIGIKTTDYQFLKEVGKGTIEVVSRPCSDLWELRSVHRIAMRRLLLEANKNWILNFRDWFTAKIRSLMESSDKETALPHFIYTDSGGVELV